MQLRSMTCGGLKREVGSRKSEVGRPKSATFAKASAAKRRPKMFKLYLAKSDSRILAIITVMVPSFKVIQAG